MKRIALYGGGFDPVHFGHLNLAIDLMEMHQLQKVYFCPAFCSPHKLDKPPMASSQNRWEMLKLAIDDIPEMVSWDFEIQNETPSYTVKSLEELQKIEKDAEIFLILSEDALFTFKKWKNPEEILKIAQLLVGTRRDSSENLLLDFPEEWKKRIHISKTRILEISSTEIRKRLQEKKYCAHLIPYKTTQYIYQKNLYGA